MPCLARGAKGARRSETKNWTPLKKCEQVSAAFPYPHCLAIAGGRRSSHTSQHRYDLQHAHPDLGHGVQSACPSARLCRVKLV